MGDLKLHLDADASSRALERGLLDRGHDVTRTPNAWIHLDASDELQLLGATAQGRCLFTFNARDFLPLAALYPSHAGAVVAAQSRWTLGELVTALDRFLRESSQHELVGQALRLNRWR